MPLRKKRLPPTQPNPSSSLSNGHSPNSRNKALTSSISNLPLISRFKSTQSSTGNSSASFRTVSEVSFKSPHTDYADDYFLDPQTGERRYGYLDLNSESKTDVPRQDYTELLHGLTHRTSTEEIEPKSQEQNLFRPPGESHIALLPSEIWQYITTFISLADGAALSFASKVLYLKLGRWYLASLNAPENRDNRIAFLARLDHQFPGHLLCHPCAQYHIRLQHGHERLKINHVTNLLYLCPRATTAYPGNRTRLTHGRTLPFAFVQLALRAKNHGPEYGIEISDLGRKWKCSDSRWEHATRYIHHNGHLFMRVTSQCIAPPDMPPAGERRIIYTQTDGYLPYFSVCSHWRDGVLMSVAKCALGHIPKPPERLRDQLKKGYSLSTEARNRNFTATQCDTCQSIRRCPECPSEYLIELKMVEDKDSKGRPYFAHAIIVTRWSDLGDGNNPASREWGAINNVEGSKYDSFKEIGKRGVSGIFESEVNNHLFLRRTLSMNPSGMKEGEEGNDWY